MPSTIGQYNPTWAHFKHPLRHKLAHFFGVYQVRPLFYNKVIVRYYCVTCGVIEKPEQLL